MNTTYANEIANLGLDNAFFRILGIIFLLALTQLITRSIIQAVVKSGVRPNEHLKKADEVKREATLIGIFRTATAFFIWLIGAVFILEQLHINLTALATGAGLFSVIIGFGAQNIIKDVLSGLFIIIENQYRVGDIVTLTSAGGEVSGLVEDISIRITRLRDLDGHTHIIQNGSITIVTNLSFGYANVNVDIRVAYDSDLAEVESIINIVGAAVAKVEALAPSIIEPIVFLRVDGFEESAVRVKALGKVEPGKQWDVAGEFRRQLVPAFAKAGIVIPFAQLTVHSVKK